MIVYTMMAVGLNVASSATACSTWLLYAAGAYTAAWFASVQFEQVTFHFSARSASTASCRGSTCRSGWTSSSPAVSPPSSESSACRSLRLRGDYLAIVTLGFGEIIPQFVRNADSLKGFDLTHGTWDHADRLARIRPDVERRHRVTGQLPAVDEPAELYFYTAMSCF